MTDIRVVHNADDSRFEVTLNGHLAVLEYRMRGSETVVFTHTEVPDALGGRGIGSRLVRGALDWAEENGFKVVPLCWFVSGYIERHPEYQRLLA